MWKIAFDLLAFANILKDSVPSILMTQKKVLRIILRKADYGDRSKMTQYQNMVAKIRVKLFSFDANEKHLNYLFRYLIRGMQKIESQIGKVSKIISDSNQQNILKLGQEKKETFITRNIHIKDPTTKMYDLMKNEIKMNQMLSQIGKTEVVLPNNQCIQCSEVFFEGREIENQNPLFQKTIGITYQEARNQVFLKKMICAVANEGSGVIIVGVNNDNRKIIEGFQMDQKVKSQLKETVEDIRRKSLNPTSFVKFDAVRVHNDIIELNPNPAKEAFRFCGRICISPYERYKLSYVGIHKKGFHSIYESYHLQKDPETGNEVPVMLTEEKLHEKMMRLYKQYEMNLYINIHKVFCTAPPYKHESKLAQQYFVLHPEENIMAPVEEKYIDYAEDAPKFKYKRSYLVVVGSVAQDVAVDDFRRALENEKILFHLEKPFKDSVEKGRRSIWHLSFDCKFENISRVLKNSNKGGYITCMPAEKCLQITLSRFTEKVKRQFNKMMMRKYPHLSENSLSPYLKLADCDGAKPVQVAIFEFESLDIAIFGYISFEEFTIRPYFIKSPEQVYKYKKQDL